jgi:flavodoxin
MDNYHEAAKLFFTDRQGGNMNTIIVYDSLFGNTERIAQAIADTLRTFGQVQAIRIEPSQSDELQRQAILHQYRATDVRLEPAHAVELQGVDMLVIGCPTQAFKATPAMLSFLEKISAASLSGLAVACFDTRYPRPLWLTGSAARVIARKLQKMGVSLLLPPESFFVTGTQGPLKSGELERAATWARMLFTKAEASQPAMR